jgi:predicted lipoprotein with Yx(FWY)xxD motif/plastocyanin
VAATATVAPAATAKTEATAEATKESVASNASATVMVADSKLGKILVDDKGMTLYMFKKDANGESACYDACATNWPPLLSKEKPQVGAGADGSLLGTVARKDGNMQVTYNKMPLYYFAKDKAPGDTNGQEVGDVWYVVGPDGKVIEAAEGEKAPSETKVLGAKIMVAETSLGKVLVGDDGRTLYMFEKDKNGESACYDACAKNWPPLVTKDKAEAGDDVEMSMIGTTTRKDGSMQVTYNKMPLYYFIKDKAAGDVNGQGVGDVWYVVTPSGEVVKAKGAAPAGGEEAAQGGAGQNVAITIRDNNFSPKTLTVKKGTTVKWTNEGTSTHTVTSDENTFKSGDLDAGKSFSFTFDKPGTYPYHCEIHGGVGGKGMSGTITVVE